MAYQSEIEKLEQRYQENPKQWFAALADAYRKSGNLDLGLEYVRGGLEMRPDYASGHIVLGRCLLDKKDDDAAGQAFEQVLELDAENIIALKSLSDIAHRRGETDQERRWLTRLLEVDPMNDEARETLAELGGPVVAVGEDAAPEGKPEPELPPPPAVATEPGAAWAAEALAEAHRKEQQAEPREEGQEAPSGPAESEPAAVGPIRELPDEFVVERTSGEQVPMDTPGPELIAGEPEAVEPGEDTTEAEAGLERGPTIEELQAEVVDQLAVSEEMGVVAFSDLGDSVEEESQGSQSVGVDSEDLAPAIDFLGDPAGEEARDQQSSSQPTPPKPMSAVDPESTEGLPLIMPDFQEMDSQDQAESVVTETMAEVYARQGLFDQAREIYQKLLESHPGVPAFERRLKELTHRPAAAGKSGDTRASHFAASVTGGESVADYLRRIFSGESTPVEPDIQPPPAPEPESADSALASAFGSTPDSFGSPTVPASDDVSLASVFGGDRHAPPGSPSPSEPPPSEENAVSFDEFYGAKEKDRSPNDTPSETDEDESPDEDFQHWLEGLKS